MARKRRQVLSVLLGLLLLIASAETFLRFSTFPAVKSAALVAALLSLFLLAWPRGFSGVVALRGLAGLVFASFAAQAAWRYPGLLKLEASQLGWIDVAVVALEAGGLFGASLLLANLLLRWLIREQEVGKRWKESAIGRGMALVVVVALLTLLAGLSLWLRRELAIDRCLDLGGSWDAASDRCER